MIYPLARDGVFWTIQGEGALSGEPMVFIRLAGCSVGCAQCDTDYRVFRRVSLEELVEEVQAVAPPEQNWPWAWITGGEPTDHKIEPLIDCLRTVGFRVALATSGVRRAPLADWLSVSPHTAAPAQTFGHEIKVVPGLNGLTWADVETLGKLSFPYRFLQPLDGCPDTVKDSIAFVLKRPGWRLGIQAHKIWGVA